VKRPGPLPPQTPQQEDLPNDETFEEPEAPERQRARLASVLPFARRRRGERAEDPADDAIDADADEADEPEERAGALAVWRASRRRRRAERAEVKRFTARARRRRRIWGVSVGAVALLAVGTVATAYSPIFAVEDIEVVGAEALDPDAINDALSSQMGTPLALVDHRAIRGAMTSFPLVETYAVESRPPHGLVVRITERTPVAVIQSDAGFTTVDAAGVALETSDAAPEGLPIAEVEGGPSSDAFAAAGQVLRALPDDIASRVTVVRATTPEDVSFELSDGGGVTVVWGSESDGAAKAQALAAGLSARPADTVSTYDVSSEGVLVVE